MEFAKSRFSCRLGIWSPKYPWTRDNIKQLVEEERVLLWFDSFNTMQGDIDHENDLCSWIRNVVWIFNEMRGLVIKIEKLPKDVINYSGIRRLLPSSTSSRRCRRCAASPVDATWRVGSKTRPGRAFPERGWRLPGARGGRRRGSESSRTLNSYSYFNFFSHSQTVHSFPGLPHRWHC